MKGDKKLLVGFLLFAIFILGFGYFSIKNKIEGPFHLVQDDNKITEEDIRQILITRDTDKDGLNDEEEIFKYYTSIYLDDSDSDGYNDKEEVETGSNPTSFESTPLNKNVAQEQKILIPQQKKDLDITEIRSTLIKMGITQETIDQVDDETLRKIYEETIKETGINPEDYSLESLGQVDVNQVKESSELLTNQDFASLDIGQIRQLILAAGADAQILSTVDDETLRKIFIEAITKAE